MADSPRRAVGCLGCCAITLIGTILFGMSFATMHPLEMGIALNNNIMSLDSSQTYFGGRNFVGIGRSFIKFPITYQTVFLGNFFDKDIRQGGSIKCRTQDGMVIYTDISFSYVIKREPENLIRLYRDVEMQAGWEELYTNIAGMAIRDVTSRFLAFDFFTQRNEISEQMKTKINQNLQRVYADVLMFELVNLEIAETFANAIEMTQVAAQDILQARAEREVAVIDAESELAVRTAEAEILIKTAQADAYALRQTAEAEAQSILAHMRTQVRGFQNMANALNMTAQQLLEFQFVSAVQDNAASEMLLNIPYPQSLAMS